MALTPAEKQRRYRERLKLNKEKYEEAKRKHRDHYHKTKRLVKDLSNKEKKNANTIWKLRQREYRQRKKQVLAVINETPPSSPIQLLNMPVQDNPAGSPSATPKMEQRYRRSKNYNSKIYREKKKLEQKLILFKRKFENLRKKLNRSKNKLKRDENENGQIVKKYRFLTSAIQKKYREIKSRKQKLLLRSLLKNDDIKKCRKKSDMFKDVLGLNREHVTKTKTSNNVIVLKKKIHRFFLRDDVSRATAGKRETITRNGKKIQKRFLLDTMKNLYEHFKKENPGFGCSYFYFTKNRPFFVVKPSADARETCLCKTYTNFAYKTRALKNMGIIQTENLCDIINATVCDDRSKKCMYNDCKTCYKKTVKYNKDKIKGTIKYCQWIRKEETYEKEGKKMKCIKNVKEELSDEVEHFLKSYEKDLQSFKKHVYNIKVQFHNFRLCLDNLQPSECAIVVDFSENYNCKYHEEVQSHHFGGSRKQVSLHTVMVYTHDTAKNYKSHSFCTLCSSTCHQPAAIWAHLDPVLQYIRNEYISVNTVHFFSDGPSTQYRQKQNFYLLCKKIFGYGFAASTWSFFEAGHGKGPADGIGGFLKRTADKLVATGRDIANANDFMVHLKNTSKIKLYLIPEDAIKEIQNELPKYIPRLVGTMKVHHIITDSENFLKFRSLSCFCGFVKRGFCDCYDPQVYNVSINDPTTRQENIEPICRDFSSDDEIPLRSLTVLKDIQNIQPRASFYQIVYGNSSDIDDDEEQEKSCNKENCLTSKNDSIIQEADDEQPSTSYKVCSSSKQVSAGDFLLVYVYSHDLKKKKYSYVCKALTPIEEDGEVKVMFLRVVGKKDAKIFRMDERDINYVEYDDIVNILPIPKMVKKGLRTYYQFDDPIDVFEK